MRIVITYLKYIRAKKRDGEEITPREKVILHHLIHLTVSIVSLLVSIAVFAFALTHKPM